MLWHREHIIVHFERDLAPLNGDFHREAEDIRHGSLEVLGQEQV
jgi:hypothetical protein